MGEQLLAVARRPDLWWAAVKMVWRTRPWPRAWRDMRAQIYGVERVSQIPGVDVVRYLEWCRSFPHSVKR